MRQTLVIILIHLFVTVVGVLIFRFKDDKDKDEAIKQWRYFKNVFNSEKHFRMEHDTVVLSNLIDRKPSSIKYLSDDVAVGLFKNEDEPDIIHFILYGVSIDFNSLDKIKILYNVLDNVEWQKKIFNRSDNDFVGKLFRNIAMEIIKSGYEVRPQSPLLKRIKNGFLKYFHFDKWITEETCLIFAEMSKYRRGHPLFEYIICMTPFLNREQMKTLYPGRKNPIGQARYVISMFSVAFTLASLIICLYLPKFRRNVFGKCFVSYLLATFLSEGAQFIIKQYEHRTRINIMHLQNYLDVSSALAQTVMSLSVILALSGKLRKLIYSIGCRYQGVIPCIIFIFGLPGLIFFLHFIELLLVEDPRVYRSDFFHEMRESKKKMELTVIILNIVMATIAIFLVFCKIWLKSKSPDEGETKREEGIDQVINDELDEQEERERIIENMIRHEMYLIHTNLYIVTIFGKILKLIVLSSDLHSWSTVWLDSLKMISSGMGVVFFSVFILSFIKQHKLTDIVLTSK